MSAAPRPQAGHALVGHTRRVSCGDETVRLRDAETGRCEATSGAAVCLASIQDGRRAAAGTYDRRVVVGDVSRPA